MSVSNLCLAIPCNEWNGALVVDKEGECTANRGALVVATSCAELVNRHGVIVQWWEYGMIDSFTFSFGAGGGAVCSSRRWVDQHTNTRQGKAARQGSDQTAQKKIYGEIFFF